MGVGGPATWRRMIFTEHHHHDYLGGLRGTLRMHALPLAGGHGMRCCVAQSHAHGLARHAVGRRQEPPVSRPRLEWVGCSHEIHLPVCVARLVLEHRRGARVLDIRLAAEALRGRPNDWEDGGGAGRSRRHGPGNQIVGRLQ